MNKLVVLAKNPNTYFIKRLTEEVGQGLALFNPWADLEFPSGDKYLVRTTGVYGSDLDLLFLKSLPQEKIINPLATIQRFRSKSSQYYWMEERGFPLLHWLPVQGTDLLTIEKFFRLYPEAVVKPIIGQGGWGIESLTWDRFKSWKKKRNTDESFLLQPLIKGAKEYRYFFILNELEIVLERTARTGVAANFQNQGGAIVSEFPEAFKSIIHQIIQTSGAEYGALDVLVDDNTLYVLELNAVPGIEQLEKVSGVNVMNKLVAKFFCQIS
jgi:glutathione synthase/RimK-type ligase-like ATP-grasp enzyme